MDHQAKLARAREIQEAIGQILLQDWDPTGVRDVPQCRGDYDSYVGGVYRLLAAKASPQEVAAHLCAVERDEMGLNPAQPSDRLPVAAQLCRLDVRFERD